MRPRRLGRQGPRAPLGRYAAGPLSRLFCVLSLCCLLAAVALTRRPAKQGQQGPPRSGPFVKLALIPKSDLPIKRGTLSSSSSRFTEKEHTKLQKLPSLLGTLPDADRAAV